MKKQKQDTRTWWRNYVKEQREATLQRLQDRFRHAEFFSGEALTDDYETYTIFTPELTHFDVEFLKRNLLEIKMVTARETNKLMLVVTRAGTQK